MSNLAQKKIYIAGHNGLVGAAIVRALKKRDCQAIIVRGSRELDLRDQRATRAFFEMERPEVVFLAAARVGGIAANDTQRGEFIYDNLMIAANVIDAAYRTGTEWLLNLGSSCIYPKFAKQPMTETELLTGPLEQTNEPYAVAKIAALKLVESYNRQYGTRYFSAMPTNLYGPNDNFSLTSSHVIPAMVRKFHEAKVAGQPEVTLWGDGSPRREFLHVDDMAAACLHLFDRRETIPTGEYFVNVGTGEDLTIKELAELIRKVVGFNGSIVWDTSKPNGTPRKLLDVSRIHRLGWKHQIPLQQGLATTYDWFVSSLATGQTRV